jgi:Tfp pilus assembly protein PilV
MTRRRRAGPFGRRADPLGPARHCDGGSTLIEVLVALMILVSAVVAMIQVFLLCATATSAARRTTAAVTLAAQKIEELRVARDVSPSSADALDRNVAGYVDHVDRFGHRVGESEVPPVDAIYTRRWSVAAQGDTLVIRVLVDRSERLVRPRPWSGEAQLLTITTRPRP